MEEDRKLRLEHLHTNIIGKLKAKTDAVLTREQMQDLCEFFDEFLYN